MQLRVSSDKKEIKEHGTADFPVRVSAKHLSDYEGGQFFWHWHPQVELTLVLEGTMLYQIGDREYRLQAGEGLFCNANVLHTGRQVDGEDCWYFSITFDPKMVYGFEDSRVRAQYVRPLLDDALCSGVYLRPQVPWQASVLEQYRQIWALDAAQDHLYALRVQILLAQIWCTLYESVHPAAQGDSGADRDRARLLAILSYLHAHYEQKISLQSVAREVGLCQSECCRFFKKMMRQSVFDYLIRYRLSQSLPLLADTRQTMTEIAEACGFSTPSYFASQFRNAFCLTPSQYRQTCLEQKRRAEP